MSTNAQPTFTGRLIAVFIGLMLLLTLAEAASRFVMPRWSEFYSGRFMRAVYDGRFGWFAMGVPGFDGWFAQNNGDFRARIHINDFGLRDNQPISYADGAIWVIGDSMTFGWGVEEDERYSTVVSRLLGQPTYNIASPGTNVCGYRALVSQMPEAVTPTAVIIGLVLENDLMEYDCAARAASGPPADSERLMGVKIWLTGHSALYNVVAGNLKRVDIIHQALIAIGLANQEQAYKQEFASARVDAVTTSTANELANLRNQLPAGTPYAVLIVPARFEIADGDPPYHHARVALAKSLAEHGIGVIDPFDAFKAAGFKPTHFVHDGHWSPLGHRLAGEAAAEWLRANLRR